MSVDLAAVLTAGAPDPRPWVPGTVVSVDDAAARVTVEVDGAPVVLRRVAARYRPGDVVAVVRDPEHSGAGQYVAGVIGPAAPAWVWGTVTAVDTVSARLSVDVDGQVLTLPHLAGTYTVNDQVAVLLDAGSGGLVWGRLANPPANPTGGPAPTPPSPVTTRLVGPVPIRPLWSGTYRSVRGAWDRWNTGSNGGRSDLYQAGSSSSGPLTGLAVYGTQVKDLGAVSIESLVVKLRSNGSGYSSTLAFTLQGSPHTSQPSGAPTVVGETVTSAAVARVGGATRVVLPADVREAFRTGAVNALAVVGSTYGGLFGTSRADGMALEVTYTKPI